MLNLFENLLSNPETMRKYNSDPVFYATFMALYDYVKAGHNLADLPWFKSVNFGVFEKADVKKAA